MRAIIARMSQWEDARVSGGTRGQPKRVAEWLTARSWVFEPARGRRGGFPKADRADYLARMSGQQPGTRRAGPRLEFMLQPR